MTEDDSNDKKSGTEVGSCVKGSRILDLCNGIVKEDAFQRIGNQVWYCQCTKAKVTYGVWILQRDQVVGTCYESR